MSGAARDEMVDGAGGLRPHWRGLLASLGSLGADGLDERARRLARASEEEGLAGGAFRCDPLPLILPGDEFAALEDGLIQRARLFEALHADLYGPQEAVAAVAVPPATLFDSPGFLRACRFVPAPLHAYAADLRRGPDGAWRVSADRFGASEGGAGGAGTARSCRRLLARVFPEAFRPLAIRPIEPFFEFWAACLRGLAPPSRTPSSIALLTPGAGAPNWFEHMALAHALGCPLVEGGDLTARGGAVFLKTLGGLQRVDVLLRRLEGRMLDPLELDPASRLGVPGLIDALRQGNVAIANPPGAEALEAPGLTDFLPALCRRLLGEAPLLASCDSLTDPQDASVAPCVTAQGLVPHPVMLRLFLVRGAAGWQALPGGLARVEAREGGTLLKDVWVLAGEHAAAGEPLSPPPPRLVLRRPSGDLPSRVADDMFWFGRIVERIDRAARLGRIALARLVRLDRLPAHELAQLGQIGRCLEAAGVVAENGGTAHALASALFAAAAPRGRLVHLLDEAARLSGALRDRLSGEMSGAIRGTLRGVRADLAAAGQSFDGLAHALDALGRLAALVAGLASENMVRGGGWRFLELGRRLERAIAVAEEIGIALDVPAARIEAELRLVLELCGSALTYRARYFDALAPGAVLDLVLADPGNPRGLVFQFERMRHGLAALEGGREAADLAAGLGLRAALLATEVQEAADPAAAAAGHAGALAALAGETEDLAEHITRRFLALLPAVQTLGWGGR